MQLFGTNCVIYIPLNIYTFGVKFFLYLETIHRIAIQDNDLRGLQRKIEVKQF